MKPKFLRFLVVLILLCLQMGHPAPGHGQPGSASYTLYPPTNFMGYDNGCMAVLGWTKPAMPNGATPPGLLGYNVYKNGANLHYMNNPNLLGYYDLYLDPGTYTYTVGALYDLGPYGQPGQTGESIPAGPLPVAVTCWQPYPFYEPWDQGTFTFNGWQFIPSQSNWTVQTTLGNPMPTAQFAGSPARQNYSVIMRTLYLEGKIWRCANIYLDFDYQLDDLTGNGTEKLMPVYLLDSTWYPLDSIANTGSGNWQHNHYDISAVAGHGYKIGIKVTGQNSANISSWKVDNIHVYSICKGPENTLAVKSGNNITLSWDHPGCDSLQNVNGYNVYRSDQYANPPYTKLNASLVAGYSYVDIIPATVSAAQYRYYVTDVQKKPDDLSFLCEAAGDTINVDYIAGLLPSDHPGIHIFPQPATDFITLCMEYPCQSCDMVDLSGKKVMEPVECRGTEIRIPVSGLSNGMYILRIKTDTGTVYRKVSVIH